MNTFPVWPCCWGHPWDCPTIVDECVQERPGGPEKLAHRFERLVNSIAWKVLGPTRRDDAPDAAQEAWLHLLPAVPRFEGRGKFCVYVATVASRAAIDYLRGIVRNKPSGPREPDDILDPRPGPDEIADRAEQSRWMEEQFRGMLESARKCRNGLPEELRRIWDLRCGKGLTREEVGRRLGVKVRTVDLRLRKIADGLAVAMGLGYVAAPAVRDHLCEIYDLLDETSDAA